MSSQRASASIRAPRRQEMLAPWQHALMEVTRVDRWVWAVRLYKTRSAATEACRGGHVRVNGAPARPSTSVRAGDRVTAHVGRDRVLEVVRIIDSRVGA